MRVETTAPARSGEAGGRSASRGAFLGVSALLFAVSTIVTVRACAAMSAASGMGGMPMPGGWTMSMAWMRMPGQSWPGAAAAFLGMWGVMMVAMMLPSLVPMLARHRRAVGGAARTRARVELLTALAGAGYFCVWTALGAAVYPLGVAWAALAMRAPGLSRAVPVLAGATVAVAGAFQLTRWKANHLACCRSARVEDRGPAGGAAAAWSHGVNLGLHCARCCAGPTAVLLALGVMDLGAMAVVGAAITAERLAPAGERVARGLGAVALGAGVVMIARAVSGG